jgi:hypothetical protein
MIRPILIALFLVTVAKATSQHVPKISLRDGSAIATIESSTLEAAFETVNRPAISLSAPQNGLGHVTDLKQGGNHASWKLPEAAVEVGVQLEGEKLSVSFRANKASRFTWPVVNSERSVRAWILPMFEGVYAPADDAKWVSFLQKQSPMSTTEGVGLPFWGWDCGDFTLTWMVTNPFNNELMFEGRDGRLHAQFKHEFTRNNPVKEFGFVIQFGKASPIEPARIYRRWIQGRGEFVSMKEKIQRTPGAGKLLGAAHVYLWGDEILSTDDIKDWKGFSKQLSTQGANTNASPGRHIWSAMRPEIQKVVVGMDKMEWVDRYSKTQVTEELGRLLVQKNFYDAGSWRGVTLDETTRNLLTRNGELTEAELCRRNCKLLAAAFPGSFAPPEDWGDGVSPKMISQLAAAGLDRLWLGAGGWEGFVRRPETVAAAKQHGYLIGPYDSYHSIHSPKATGDNTWPTAQFDRPLYETGGIVQANGEKKTGFKKKGYLLSPAAARPYVERRVNHLMNAFHANSWFMDCDGFGEYFDDYSEAHPATQQTDLQARCSRLAWIRDTFGAVIGSEGCSAGVAGTIHFAHGVMTPVIGWGDPDLKDKSSKYFLGAYYPPNGPAVFFKPVPTKEEYRYIYFDPRFRLPLFETVFHDSVVATHHWSAASGKFRDQARTVELLELLYNVPPLYHLNLQEFAKQSPQMKKHHDFFSPLHRETGLLPLTEFEWLTPDRLVQRTMFGDKIQMVANFREADFTFEKTVLPAQSILAQRRDSGKILIFTPTESK